MMDRRKRVGRQGEQAAADYLVDNGYQIIERNWRCMVGELDLVVQKEETLVFVEVRTRRGVRFGSAEESITPIKQARLIELAHSYLNEKSPPHRSWRIDVIAVRLDLRQPHFNHIENAVGW